MAIEIAGLADIVRIHGKRQPDTAALVHDGRTTTYAELDRVASRVANALIADGIRPQTRAWRISTSRATSSSSCCSGSPRPMR